MISEDLIEEFASCILVPDVNNYIEKHKEEYQNWQNKKIPKDNDNKNSKNIERSKEYEFYSIKQQKTTIN